MHISLKPPLLEDAAVLLDFELANRAYFEHWINARQPAFYSLDGVRGSIATAQAERESGSAYQYLIWQGGAIAGRINLRGVERHYFHKAELGYRVGEAHVGRGVASKALASLCELAFGELGLARLEATVRPANAGSLKVLERNGFSVFGKAERSMLLHGEWHDLWHMERRSPRIRFE
ncbi:GNAT family N-acetyltransferase [Chromobacterium sp. IIBBL 290-4]|uniref:GNAT family N-acetyltransferase n=1 Tax=Chromobacterium sp. IIBBL 290-4 TaxID=2953890 RepID=UPI0020B7E57A|nr:GNAT family N-acetyltransferase [Chromobacterium sp. IIBBL 290-4]UTH72793.1 GNAT family N-acetyltransferase [Chromobacterium sp. IIBBL 290-4]